MASQKLSSYYEWKNIRKQYKNNKLKTIAPTWNDEFRLSHGSYMSDIQDYAEYIIEEHDTLTTISIYVYIDIIYNILAFKINDEHKLESQT